MATDGALARALIAHSGREVTPKQAWTPVAEFGLLDIPAVNYGPGDPQYAHKRDEQVAASALVESYETLAALVRSGSSGALEATTRRSRARDANGRG